MSQYCDGLLLPGDRLPPEEFDLKYFWWSELFFMNQVLSHIIAWNETMGNRGAVTLRWSMGEWTQLITSRDVLLHFSNRERQLLFQVVFLLMTSGFSRRITYIRIRAFLYFWHQLYLMEETRLWQVDKCVERFSSCLDWEKLTMAVAWSVMGCLSLIRNRFWVWEETTGIWVSHGGSKRKKWAP